MKKFDMEVRLSREMTLMDATLIDVGAMIGAGIFVLTGIAAGVAGPALIVTFCLNGLVALFTAMSYAELGSCYHDAGGGYLWVKKGLPNGTDFFPDGRVGSPARSPVACMRWASVLISTMYYVNLERLYLNGGSYRRIRSSRPQWRRYSPM